MKTLTSALIWNRLRARWRIPLKSTLILATVFVVCYPHPRLFLVHLGRWRNPNALINPSAKGLDRWIDSVRSQMSEGKPAPDTLKVVERFVLQNVEYEWDWVNWGNADYLPTVEEVLDRGKEDCDGRAVVAASIMVGLGFRARLVTDFAHVWVATDQGEFMGPRKHQSIVATDRGLSVRLSAMTEFPRALAYGISPFPLIRELVILGVVWLMLLGPRGTIHRSIVGLVLLLAGLLTMRVAGQSDLKPIVWAQLAGLLGMVLGATVTARGGWWSRRFRVHPDPPGQL